MRVVCAPDSFKESMTATEAAAAMGRGVRAVLPAADVVEIPLSDGGEGFLEALSAALKSDLISVTVDDALGRPTQATFGLTTDGVAIIEMASAAGLEQVVPQDRDIWHSSTTGVGQLVLAALNHGATRLVLGIGGSATTDAGAGMLAALGVRYLDADGRCLRPVPAELLQVDHIDSSGMDPRLRTADVQVACDVTNPLCGPRGAAAVFGPQKGATQDDVPALDTLLNRLQEIAGGVGTADKPGAGAAGGLGYALMHYLDAHLRPGIDLVTETIGLADVLADADLVLTGEGSVDAQTLNGKTPAGVTRLAAAAGIPVIVLAGRVGEDADMLLEHGVTALMPILPGVMPLSVALEMGPKNLERATATSLRLVTAMKQTD